MSISYFYSNYTQEYSIMPLALSGRSSNFKRREIIFVILKSIGILIIVII